MDCNLGEESFLGTKRFLSQATLNSDALNSDQDFKAWKPIIKTAPSERAPNYL